MAKIPYAKLPGKIIAGAALVGLLGLGAAQLSVETISGYEGYVPQAYRDPVGIWTKCFGDIRDVTPGARYSFEQCVRSLNSQVLAHAGPVLKCLPGLAGQPDKVKAAMVSMAYLIAGTCSNACSCPVKIDHVPQVV